MVGKILGREALTQIASIVTPDTLLRWHRRLVALVDRVRVDSVVCRDCGLVDIEGKQGKNVQTDVETARLMVEPITSVNIST